MRKALKIKTSVLLVAWMVIFTHSIIPILMLTNALPIMVKAIFNFYCTGQS
ncbi:MAG: hypothetical protein U0T33_08735 [Bacteroidales bacterium]